MLSAGSEFFSVSMTIPALQMTPQVNGVHGYWVFFTLPLPDPPGAYAVVMIHNWTAPQFTISTDTNTDKDHSSYHNNFHIILKFFVYVIFYFQGQSKDQISIIFSVLSA